MASQVRIEPGTLRKNSEYDVFIAAVGYEARARYAVERLRPEATSRIGLAFTRDHVLEFERNKQVLSDYGYKIIEVGDDAVSATLSDAIDQVEGTGPIRIGIDISSFTRRRIATIFDVLRTAPGQTGREIITDWYYTIARFSPPPQEFVPNVVAEPVLPTFAGWTDEPERPLAAIIGLGYEQDKALGAVELVQASFAWALKPIGFDSRYDSAVIQANATFLEFVRPARMLEYRVEQSIECYTILESLVYGVLKTGNVLLLPFGPKVFALCCLLVAHIYPAVAVWRVSAAGGEKPVNRRASGRMSSLSVRFLVEDEVSHK